MYKVDKLQYIDKRYSLIKGDRYILNIINIISLLLIRRLLDLFEIMMLNILSILQPIKIIPLVKHGQHKKIKDHHSNLPQPNIKKHSLRQTVETDNMEHEQSDSPENNNPSESVECFCMF
jgi:hypothetical protein